MDQSPLKASYEEENFFKTLKSEILIKKGDRSAFVQPRKCKNEGYEEEDIHLANITPPKLSFDTQAGSTKRRTRDRTLDESFDSIEFETSIKKPKSEVPATEEVSDFVKSRLNDYITNHSLLSKTTPKKNWWNREEVLSFHNYRMKNLLL